MFSSLLKQSEFESVNLDLPGNPSLFARRDKVLSWKKGDDFHKDVPKGCVALYVGQGEEQRRCVIPVEYINHPLFDKFLKEAEEEYGFEQKGRITIPCNISDFEHVQEVIHRESHESHRHAHVSCFG